MDRGAWWTTVHGITKESDMTEQLTLSQDKNTIGGRGTLRKQVEYNNDVTIIGNCTHSSWLEMWFLKIK